MIVKSSKNRLTISAVICTRDRPKLLERALKSLIQQSYPADDLIVIDNAPSDNQTKNMVENNFSEISYFREQLPGLDFARNKAISVVSTDIIAFLDDDAIADKYWIENFLSAFEKNCLLGCCTGRVEPYSLKSEAQQIFEANGGFSRGLKPIMLPMPKYSLLHGLPAPDIAWAISIGNGTSMAIRSEVFSNVGNFDEALDLGEPLPGGGDLDMFWRILTAGYQLQYDPDVIALHEHRKEIPAMINQLAGHQRALIAFLVKTLKQTKNISIVSIILFLFWRLLKPGYRILRKPFLMSLYLIQFS